MSGSREENRGQADIEFYNGPGVTEDLTTEEQRKKNAEHDAAIDEARQTPIANDEDEE